MSGVNLFEEDSHEINGNLTYKIGKNRNLIWANNSNPNSLRLTSFGLQTAMHMCNLQMNTFKYSHLNVGNILLAMEKHFSSPYFIHTTTSYSISDDNDALMLRLCNGDLKYYLSTFP